MRKIAILIFISIFCLFSIPFLQAQYDFRQGFYVNVSGDTISGLVNYPSGKSKYKDFTFKLNRASSTKKYDKADAQAYGIGQDRIFQLKRLPEEEGEIEVFMELLIQGKVSLYQYRQGYFLAYEDKIKRIYIEETRVEKDGKSYLQKSSHHKEILADALKDCVDLRRKIIAEEIAVLPRQKILVSLLEEYYRCTGEDYMSYKRIPWSKIKLGAQIGAEITQMALSTKRPTPFVEEIDFSTWRTWTASLKFEYSIPRLSERMSFVFEPGYTQNFFQGYYESLEESQRIIYRDYTFKFEEVSFPLGFKYLLFPKWKNTFVAAGLIPQFYFNLDLENNEEVVNLVQNTVQYQDLPVSVVSEYQIGTWIQGGFTLLHTDQFSVPIQLTYQNIAGIVRSPFLFGLPFSVNGIVVPRGVQHSIILSCGILF